MGEAHVIELTPIGIFCSKKKHAYDAARQAGFDQGSDLGWVELEPGHDFEQALRGLEGFSHIWILYQFHKNTNWNPIVQPPRGEKQGVFATRSPHRPNAIGMSVVEVEKIEGRKIFVKAHDILDGSPILDIKPYHVAADCFPGATQGWIAENLNSEQYQVIFSQKAKRQLQFLSEQGVTEIANFLIQQLGAEPLNSQKKRVFEFPKMGEQLQAIIAYRTWRALFLVAPASEAHKIEVQEIYSGYSQDELAQSEDKYNDKDLHRKFKLQFPQAEDLPRFRANADSNPSPKLHKQ